MELVILARDGVINAVHDGETATAENWHPVSGSLEAIARLSHAGKRVVVAGNEPGIGQRLIDAEELNRLHDKMHRMLAEVGGSIEAVFFCPHRPGARCECRFPRPGLFTQIAHRLRISLEGVPVVGATNDMLVAALTVGMRPILISANGAPPGEAQGFEVYPDLASATEAMLGDSTPSQPMLRAH